MTLRHAGKSGQGYCEGRVKNQLPMGADGSGNVIVYKSKEDIPQPVFEIIGDDDDPADISDISAFAGSPPYA
jgi:hypothetical protein